MISAWRFFRAVDGVEDFLLREPVMVGEALGINQFAAELDEALLKTFRLGDAAQRRDFFAGEQIESLAFAGEDVLEIKRLMHALDDGGGGI